MARSVPFLFCRYTFTKKGKPLSAEEQHEEFMTLRGRTVLHRKGDDDDAEPDTLTMMPGMWLQKKGRQVVVWSCGYYLKVRTEASYNPKTDAIEHAHLASNGIKYTQFVAVPSLGIVAICDRASDATLSAAQGISRLKSVIRHGAKDLDLQVKLAASQSDMKKALTDWSLDQVQFTVRPFNPHPRDPGRQLSALFDRDGIGKLVGTAVPAPGKVMRMAEGGYIEETLGLVEHGYGQLGVSGQTPNGMKASIKKPTFSQDKSENTKHQEDPHSLRVLVEDHGGQNNELERAVAKALIEFYEPKT